MQKILLIFLIALNCIIMTGAVTIGPRLLADVAAHGREIANLQGVQRDQAATIQYLTHPATIQRRTIDFILRQGEFDGHP